MEEPEGGRTELQYAETDRGDWIIWPGMPRWEEFAPGTGRPPRDEPLSGLTVKRAQNKSDVGFERGVMSRNQIIFSHAKVIAFDINTLSAFQIKNSLKIQTYTVWKGDCFWMMRHAALLTT